MRFTNPTSLRVLVAFGALLTTVGLLGTVPETLVAAEPDKTASPSTEAGFHWLVKQQKEDGSWDFNTGRNPSTFSAPTVGTALAVWPLLRAGQTPEKGAHAQSVAKGLAFIQSRMQFNEHGCHAPNEAGNMYGHAIITAALCEAYSRTQDVKLKAVAQGAVDYIVHA